MFMFSMFPRLVYIYIYIYIYMSLSLSLSLYIYIYICIYIYVYSSFEITLMYTLVEAVISNTHQQDLLKVF